jgi:hypothetical protein
MSGDGMEKGVPCKVLVNVEKSFPYYKTVRKSRIRDKKILELVKILTANKSQQSSVCDYKNKFWVSVLDLGIPKKPYYEIYVFCYGTYVPTNERVKKMIKYLALRVR